MLKRLFVAAVAVVSAAGLIAIAALLAAGVATALNLTGTNTEWRNSTVEIGVVRLGRDTGLTATAGGGQTNALQLSAGLNRVSTVASGNDSVKLPACLGGGLMVVVSNQAASNSANVFPFTGDAINALSANAAFALAANKTAIFFCGVDGTWAALLTA